MWLHRTTQWQLRNKDDLCAGSVNVLLIPSLLPWKRSNPQINKKVLLRERKRHRSTARHVASDRYGGGGGVHYPVMVGGVPHPDPPHHPDLVRGGTSSRPGQGGYPGYPTTIQTWSGVPHPDLARGYQGTLLGTPPPSRPSWVPPHHQDLARVPPPASRPGWGTPPTHHPDLTGVPPPPVEVWTDKLKTVPSPILGMRGGGGNKSLQLWLNSYEQLERFTRCDIMIINYRNVFNRV